MLKGQLTQVLNTNFDGRYLFGGQMTTEPPFGVNEVTGETEYRGDNNGILREIAPKVNLKIESDGSLITQTTGTSGDNDKVMILLTNISKAMDSGDTDALSGNLLKDMDMHIDNVIRFRSKMGATYNRLEAAGERNSSENLNMTELLSKSEDIDLAEKMMQFSVMSTVYQASLATGAKILQPSLLDYIR